MAALPDVDFIRLFEELGPHKLAKKLDIGIRPVYARRKNLERKLGRPIIGPSGERKVPVTDVHPHRINLDIINGHVLVGSDAHFWPGPTSTAWRAFVKLHKELKPRTTILNGDVLDFPKVSRHSPIGWENQPTVQEEIEFAQERLAEIESQKTKSERLIWTLGNHDARFETRLATVAPEYAKVAGMHLQDHFPCWEPAWVVWLNDAAVVKHRFRGGIHATHNNVLWAGKTMVTGHLHSAQVRPFTDYAGTRYGVDTGCLADPDHAAFVDYTESNPKNWRSGFCVLTFKDRQLLMPELASAWDDNHIQFRGELIRV